LKTILNVTGLNATSKRLLIRAAIGDATKAIELNPGAKKDLGDFIRKARAKLAEME